MPGMKQRPVSAQLSYLRRLVRDDPHSGMSALWYRPPPNLACADLTQPAADR
jgi:hypothetical protein